MNSAGGSYHGRGTRRIREALSGVSTWPERRLVYCAPSARPQPVKVRQEPLARFTRHWLSRRPDFCGGRCLSVAWSDSSGKGSAA